MSFEGYHRFLCKNGHLDTEDVYDAPDESDWRCPTCNEPCVWSDTVDETNLGYDWWDAPKELQMISLYGQCICPDCDHRHYKGPYPPLYKIPGEDPEYRELSFSLVLEDIKDLIFIRWQNLKLWLGIEKLIPWEEAKKQLGWDDNDEEKNTD